MWKETRNVEREVRFMKIREGFDSINAAYTDDFFFIFFLFSRISNNNPVREKCRIYAMIQLGHKNCGSNRAVRTMEKQLDWPFRRSQNPACQASLLSPVLRSAYFSFFFLLLFFFPFFFFIRDDYRMRYGSRLSVKIPRVIRDLCDIFWLLPRPPLDSPHPPPVFACCS